MLKRPSTYVVAITMLSAVGIAVMQYSPTVVQVLQLNSVAQLQSNVFTVIGVSLALVTASVVVLLLEQRHELESLAERLEARTKGPSVRALRDEQFYAQFLQAARHASSSVCICYFGPRSPDSVPDTHRREYYKKIHGLMRKRGDYVRFRRLLRHSRENEIWAAGVVKRLIGKPKVDLAILRDLDATDPKNVMPLALSVQIIDQASAWVVAVQSHEQTGEYRDLVIEGGELPRALQLYFDRLWRHADVILDSGTLTPAGEALLARVPHEPTTTHVG